MPKSLRRTDDLLWKSILEQTFADFLRFFFPDADDVFDLARPFEYLDKEFESFFPPQSNRGGVRYVDKLVKVHLKRGGERYVLAHIEVQSHKGKGNLAERMFDYFYKIKDKYKVPVTAIAILADTNTSYRPECYIETFMGTTLSYKFNSYKILDQDESALRANSNPFAVVVLTTLLALLHRKVNDEQLKDIKHDLYDQMMLRKMERSARQGIYDFLTYYVRFENSDNLSIFEQEVKEKLGRSEPMGTQEYLLDRAKKEGKLEERAKAKKLIAEKDRESAKKMLQNQ